MIRTGLRFLMLTRKDGNRMNSYKVLGGIYLVIDPSIDLEALFSKLRLALEQGVAVVQIWEHWDNVLEKENLVTDICNLCHMHQVPVLINNAWELVNRLPLSGVHFDVAPKNFDFIKKSLADDFIIGLTCGNDLADVDWADRNALDYISFCSIFPSSTSNSCELISFDTIRRARELTTMPIFLAGGISLGNMEKLQDLNFDGIAVVSGIMDSSDPAQTTISYLELLNKKMS